MIHNRTRDSYTLLLTTRKLARVRLFLAFEPHLLKQESGKLTGLFTIFSEYADRRKRQVLEYGQVREQVKVLEHKPCRKANVAERLCGSVLDFTTNARTGNNHVLAIDTHLARFKCFKLRQATEKRTLAGTARPDNRKHLARLQVKRDILEHMQVAKGLLDVFYLEDRRRFVHVFHSTPHL